MNTKLISALLLTASLGATVACATPASTIAYAFPVSHVSSQHLLVKVGSSRTAVRQVLGAPNRKLSPDVFVYNNFHANQELANDFGCNAMIVTFAEGKVVDLKFANLRAVNLIAMNSKSKPAASSWDVAASK